MSKWYEKSGNSGDVVISSRIRLARNLKNYVFPVKLSMQKKKEVENIIKDSILNCNSYISAEFKFIELSELSQNELVSLVEKHLVSPEFITNTNGKALIINNDESVSIMINEEDHIRIQVMKEGLSLAEAYEAADKIDSLINENAQIAFDSKLGYLTQCPTNLGTGMRASIMLHLPALQDSGAIPRIASSLSKLGITVRGTYGEGTNVIGNMYQLSNQITLGLSEEEAINNLTSIANQLIAEERKSQAVLMKNIAVQDKISRAEGVLKTARLLSSEEFMSLISLIRIGVSTDSIKGITLEDINKLTAEVQPATIECNYKNENRDVIRAELVRKCFSKAL